MKNYFFGNSFVTRDKTKEGGEFTDKYKAAVTHNSRPIGCVPRGIGPISSLTSAMK